MREHRHIASNAAATRAALIGSPLVYARHYARMQLIISSSAACPPPPPPSVPPANSRTWPPPPPPPPSPVSRNYISPKRRSDEPIIITKFQLRSGRSPVERISNFCFNKRARRKGGRSRGRCNSFNAANAGGSRAYERKRYSSRSPTSIARLRSRNFPRRFSKLGLVAAAARN
jgi:hypothetical protein